MPDLQATLRSYDDAKSEHVAFTIPHEEWALLLSFHQEAERLRSTRFVQEQQGGQIAVTLSVHQAIRSAAKQVDKKAVGAMLLKLRPFVLENERTFFHKVKNLLKRRLDHRAFRMHIDLLDDAFSLRTLQRGIRVPSGRRHLLSVPVVMDWLNAYEYHRDPDKKKAVTHDLGFFGLDQNGMPVILFALTEMIQSVLDLDGLVETLIELQSGNRTEFRCPPGLLA